MYCHSCMKSSIHGLLDYVQLVTEHSWSCTLWWCETDCMDAPVGSDQVNIEIHLQSLIEFIYRDTAGLYMRVYIDNNWMGSALLRRIIIVPTLRSKVSAGSISFHDMPKMWLSRNIGGGYGYCWSGRSLLERRDNRYWHSIHCITCNSGNITISLCQLAYGEQPNSGQSIGRYTRSSR